MNNTNYLEGYRPGKHDKNNPFNFKGSYEEFLKIPYHSYITAAAFDPGSFYKKDYIKCKCIDCDKEIINQIASYYHFEEKVEKGEADSIQKGFLCKSCKIKRLYQRDYGVDNPNQLQEIKINNRKTFYENHPNIIPYSEEPIELNMEWEDFCKLSMQTGQKVKFICKDCKEETILTFGALRGRKKHTINADFYCKKCQTKHSTYNVKVEDLNFPEFTGHTFEEFLEFKKENNLSTEATVIINCRRCGKKDFIKVNNILHRKRKDVDLCSGCYMEDSLDELSIEGSEIEEEIYNFIKSFYKGKIERHNRYLLDPQEIDIYLPELKLGIEFNGDYWHNSKIKDKYYHQNKSLKCLNLGVRLFHIYEKEWYQSSDIFKDLLYKIINNQEPINTENVINLPFDKGNYIYYLNNGYHIKEVLEPQLKPGYKKNEVFDSGIIILEK